MNLAEAFASTGGCCRRATRRADGGRDRRLPRRALGHGLRARPEPPRRAGAARGGRRCRRSRASTWWRASRARRRRSCERARRAALRARRRARTIGAAGAGRVEGELDALDLDVADGRVDSRDYPDALGRLWSALNLPALRRRAASAHRPATSSSTGVAPTTWAAEATARSTGTTPRRAAARRPEPAHGAGAVVDHGRDPNGARPLPVGSLAPDDRRQRDPPSASAPRRIAVHVRASARRHAPSRTTGVQLAKFCVVGGSGYASTSACSRCSPSRSRRPPPGGRHRRVPRRRDEQLLVEPPLDVPRPRRPRRLPGGALLRRQRRGLPVRARDARAAGQRRGVPKIAAQAISIVAATPLNFLGNKMWSFGSRSAEPRPALLRGGVLAAVALARPPVARASDRDASPRSQLPTAQTQLPKGYELTALQAIAIAAARGRRCATSCAAPGPASAHRVHERPRRWQVSYFREGPASRCRCRWTIRSGTAARGRGPATRWPGAWRAATRARSAARSTRSTSGCRSCAALPAAVRRPAPAVPAAAPRPADAGRLRVSHVFFNRGEHRHFGAARLPGAAATCWSACSSPGFRPRARRTGRSCRYAVWRCSRSRLRVPAVGFRIGLNMIDSNVIDVGYAGVIGADQDHARRRALYGGSFPADNAHGDTYGPLIYLAYVPFEQVCPGAGAGTTCRRRTRRPIAFDLLTLLGLFLLGRRLRAGPAGTSLGVALAYAWVAYPVHALRAVDQLERLAGGGARRGGAPARSPSPPAPRRRSVALGARRSSRRSRSPRCSRRGRDAARSRAHRSSPSAAVVVVLAIAWLPFIPNGGLRELCDRTIGYQVDRSDSPFSVWGQASLGWLHSIWEVGVVGLALRRGVRAAPRAPRLRSRRSARRC